VTRLYTDDVELYDIAFTWDIDDEVSWLVERFGPSCRTELAAYDGSESGRPRVELEHGGGLMWHELSAP